MTTDVRTLSRSRPPARYAGIERVQFPDNPAATRAFERIDETLRRFFGARSPFLERAVTWDELVGSGVVEVNFPTVGGSTPGDPVVTPPTSGGEDDPSVPPAPTGLAASAAVITIILEWDQPAFTYFGHTEIWRASADNLALAVNIGETQSFIYADVIGQSGVTSYYWIRHISKAGNPGAFNAVPGVSATTGQAGPGEIAALAITADKMAAASITAANAALADAVVTTAKIANLNVTDAKIGSMSVGKLTAGSLAVGQYIQSAGFSAGTTGFRINADGTAEFNDVTVRGHVEADTGYFAGTLSAASGSFTGSLSGASGTFSGTLTASNVVTTANMVDESITAPRSGYTDGTSATISSTPTSVTSCPVPSGATSVVISASCLFKNTGSVFTARFELRRDSTVLQTRDLDAEAAYLPMTIEYVDSTPGSGSTYALYVYMVGSGGVTVQKRFISAFGTKGK